MIRIQVTDWAMWLGMDAEEAAPQSDVDHVIDQLDRRIVPEPDRTRLRKAVDRADAPDKSRAGQDAALGRVTGHV